jgi:large subunit ribosomal protein L30
MPSLIRIKLVRSPISLPKDQRATVQALGLRRLNHTRELPATPTLLGQVKKVQHLVSLEIVGEAPPRA